MPHTTSPHHISPLLCCVLTVQVVGRRILPASLVSARIGYVRKVRQCAEGALEKSSSLFEVAPLDYAVSLLPIVEP